MTMTRKPLCWKCGAQPADGECLYSTNLIREDARDITGKAVCRRCLEEVRNAKRRNR